ncbi:VOC family protein [Streptomyces regalis]|uniref:Glyoxalase n=1 Tax=Streptomyces regalis TaxID=68262 RepID=A0A0X3VLS6_9ACTN|nr:VOC family protein [Streptomyces regalis]KUL45751.1 glyoxalase [Streptomyces regalis]
MALEWEQVTVDAADPAALGRWWAEALGWVVVNDSAEEYEIRPEHDRLPGLIFVPVPEGKTVKNRLHPACSPRGAAENRRLLHTRAKRSDRTYDGRSRCGGR